MKYKVGDRVCIIAREGKVITYGKSGRARVQWDTGEHSYEFEEEIQPDYRALYEQEKAIRMAADALITHIQKYYQLEDSVHEKIFNNYQQLKQQYGQDIGSTR